MDKRKSLFKKTADDVHCRSKYTGPSRRFTDWVDSLGFGQTFLGRQLQNLEAQYNVRRFGVLFLFCLLLSFIIFWDVEVSHKVRVGDVAPSEIKSPITFQLTDEAGTNDKRQVAQDTVPPVFDFDPNVYEALITRVYKSFREMRKELKAGHWDGRGERHDQEVKDFALNKAGFERELGRDVPDRAFEWLTENQFSAPIENVLIRALLKWGSRRIIDGQLASFKADDSPLIVRRPRAAGGAIEEFTLKRGETFDVKRPADFDLSGVLGIDRLSERDAKQALEVARLLISPNLIYNRQETMDRRQHASDAVLPVQVSIRKGQSIINAGSVISPLQFNLVHELNSLRSAKRTDFISVVVAILFLILVTVFFSYLKRAGSTRMQVTSKDVYAMGSVILMTVVMNKLYMFVADAALLHRQLPVPANNLLFAAPTWAGPMLVGLMIPFGEIVWLVTIFQSITLAMMVDTDFNFVYLLVTAIGGIAAARGVVSCSTRNDIYKAGLRTGIVNAAVLTTVSFLQPPGETALGTLLLWNIPLGLVGGVMSSLVAMALIPLFETVFNYTTDVKLLELASLNHPVMRELIVKAPGTYHHSLMVGSMCEAGAREIGANPLLAKVMAYYHDVGKMEHAQYFIENQRGGVNPHDHISPNMSKTILVAHVKDGAELGLKFKLGSAIVDGILQHHGTTLISYFYNKALREQDEAIDCVQEDDFRYPGPKPQFKEAALLMLADSIEAAARSLDEPTPGRLTSLVRNIIQSKFLDGQLEECDLTLRDLSVIEENYRRVILGIYHQRIDYPAHPAPRGAAVLQPGQSITQRSQRKRGANG